MCHGDDLELVNTVDNLLPNPVTLTPTHGLTPITMLGLVSNRQSY